MELIEIIEKAGEKFNKIGHRKYFQEMRNRYIFTIKEVMKFASKGANILDVGASPGHISVILQELNYQVYAIDLCPEEDFITCKDSINIWKDSNIRIVKSDINNSKLPFKDKLFDLILFTETIEHLYLFPDKTLMEIKRVLKDNGYLVLSTPNVTSLKNRIKFLFGNNIYNSIEIMCNLSIYKRHNREYNYEDIKILLEIVGFEIVKKYFLTFNKTNRLAENFIKFLYRVIILFFPQFGSEIFVIAKKKKS